MGWLRFIVPRHEINFFSWLFDNIDGASPCYPHISPPTPNFCLIAWIFDIPFAGKKNSCTFADRFTEKNLLYINIY
jgi:hypothetical protein